MMTGQVGGRQAQAPEPEQMPVSEVDARRRRPGTGLRRIHFQKVVLIISQKKVSFYIYLYPNVILLMGVLKDIAM